MGRGGDGSSDRALVHWPQGPRFKSHKALFFSKQHSTIILLPQAPKNHLLILVLRCANASGSFELLHGSRVEPAKLDPARVT